jgi:UDP-2,4-diacetamido-2,4,6-trideoxy-beta-L-altropyranose hydrolase
MRIVFRSDASLAIGTGHVMRCLTLASALRERDVTVSFVCREHDGHLCGLIEKRGFTVCRLPVPKAGTQAEGAPTHAAWLGATWVEDAEQTRAAIAASSVKPDWLVVDHYAIEQCWEKSLRSSAGRIMVIDDLADRVHDCDLLLDQNLVAQMHIRYADKVPATCGLLLGPEYALLQPLYAELHDRVPARKGPIRHIFIFFGGVDGDNLTGRSLSAFLQLNRTDIDVDVVITAGSPYAAIIRDQIAGHGNIHLHSNLPTLAPLMAKADLAIGAGGATSWERLCLGLPSLVVTLAENQRPVAAYLHGAGLAHWIGHKDQVDQQIIADTLARTLTMDSLNDWSRRCSQICTGQGVFQVLNSMKIINGEMGDILCSTKALEQ